MTARMYYDADADASALEGKTVVVFGGSYGIGADVVRLAESYGATGHRVTSTEGLST